MGAIPPDVFTEELRRLERERLATFVADLWAAAGWETAIDGDIVVAERDDECQRLAIPGTPRRLLHRWRSPAIPDDADAVIRLDAEGRTGTNETAVIGASALRDRLLFGVDADAADRICDAHLGVAARGERWETAPDPDPPARASDSGSERTRGRTMAAATLVFAFLVLVVGPGALLGAAPIELPQQAGSSTDGAVGPVPAPTCEREPGEVATTVANTLQPPSEGASGLQVLWNFTDPQIREDRHYRSFRGFYAAPQFDPLREDDSVVLDGVVRNGLTADVFVIARTEDGNVPYLFSMVRRERSGQSCWSIQAVARTGDG